MLSCETDLSVYVLNYLESGDPDSFIMTELSEYDLALLITKTQLSDGLILRLALDLPFGRSREIDVDELLIDINDFNRLKPQEG